MRKLSEEQWQSLVSAMARDLTRLAPDWTTHNPHDPGTTLLELLAFLAEDLQRRNYTIDAQGRMLARRVAQSAQSLADMTNAKDCPPGLQRLNYFDGRLLSADDLSAEQDYFRDKFHRRNRAHGTGVVTGLQVTLERTGSKTQVVIAPGLAFNSRGEEIEVIAPTPLPLPAQGKALLVLLRYAEQPCRPVPALVTDPQANAQEQMRFSRITETFSATLTPSPDDSAVALARLNFSRGRWALDRKFTAAQVR